MSVEGIVMELKLNGPPAGLAIPVAAVSPIAALTNPNPPHLADATSTSAGVFKLDCFDVTGVQLGLIVLADEADPLDTTNFPLLTGVAGWSDPANATCLTGARVFAMKTAAVNQLAALINDAHTGLGFDPATSGIILGMTMDPTGMPTGGATVLKEVPGGTNVEPTNICYVTLAGTPPALTCGTETSAAMGGLFVIPGPFGGGLSPPTLIGVKAGCAWTSGRFKASTANGKAFVIGLIADSCTP